LEAVTGEQHDPDLHVEVTAPRFPNQPRAFTFEPEASVGAAAAQAASAFQYDKGTWSFRLEGRELDRNLSLAAAGVDSGDKLGLIDTGGGV
jgi:hypothetical protein